MNQLDETYWNHWQMSRYGSSLPDSDPREDENKNQMIADQQVWFEREQEVWLENQSL